jgi:hypothetical protein
MTIPCPCPLERHPGARCSGCQTAIVHEPPFWFDNETKDFRCLACGPPKGAPLGDTVTTDRQTGRQVREPIQ